MIMNEQAKSRFGKDLKEMSGGHDPIHIFDYTDGWSATFKEEIAALRVAVRYKNGKVRFCPNVNLWQARV